MSQEYHLYMWGRRVPSFVPLLERVEPAGPLVNETIVSMSISAEYAIAVTSSQSAYFWGSLLGEGLFTPVQIDTGGKLIVKAIAKQARFLLLTTTNELLVYNNGIDGGYTNTIFLSAVIDVAAGEQHTLVLTSDNILVAWRQNDKGQLVSIYCFLICG